MYGITVRNHCASYNRSRASIVLFCPHESLVHSFSQNANCPDSPLGNKRTRFLNMSWKLPSATPESHLWQVLDGKDNINNVKLPNFSPTFFIGTARTSHRNSKGTPKEEQRRSVNFVEFPHAYSESSYPTKTSPKHWRTYDLPSTYERRRNDLATHTHFCVLDPSQKKKEAHPSGRASLSVFGCLPQQWVGYLPLCLSQKTPSV